MFHQNFACSVIDFKKKKIIVCQNLIEIISNKNFIVPSTSILNNKNKYKRLK